ncbi:unnamed protein product [Kluyveromyces dobzhanskii CBS 2104]|uniref:WGS project CCBQ000000000 data, contig 00014 n=1 Tax=Kluyveromyces dobzhanskii CBS 2104 TaxID=1427455 RepID=A0A0A8L714_9SACH|nr:unnamed protein product [Kluyveromyces dobzhanskii CBS 2104]
MTEIKLQLRSLLLFIAFFAYTFAAPVDISHKKRAIVTRVHTASTTNTVTDFYSTTTQIKLAPTVEFIISGSVTITTTLPLADGSVPTEAPSVTITSVYNERGAEIAVPTDSAAVAEEVNTSVNTVVNDGTSTLSPVIATTQSPTNNDAGSAATTASGNTSIDSSENNNNGNANNDETTTSSTTSSTTSEATTSESTTSETTTSSTISTGTTTAGSATGVPTAIVYSPYNDDSTCKDASSVYSDLQTIQGKGINKIRIYGTDCNSLETVQPAAVKLGMTINQGFWIGSSGVNSIDTSVADLISYAGTNGWGVFDFITIGNEAIISGYCSVDDLIGKISSVKAQLKSAGYNGLVTTSEPPVIFETYPSLCTSSEIDFVGINSHAYFDPNSKASTAGSFVKNQLQIVKDVCGTDNVRVTETGYPSSGIQNGGNIPSKDNQIIAVNGILEELGGDVTILSSFNDYWKNPGSYGVEQSFGVLDFLS